MYIYLERRLIDHKQARIQIDHELKVYTILQQTWSLHDSALLQGQCRIFHFATNFIIFTDYSV